MTCGQCVQLEQRTHNNTITSNQIQGAAFTQGTQGGGGGRDGEKSQNCNET
jgi:hypothetical protein